MKVAINTRDWFLTGNRTLDSDYVIGGGWGNHISWLDNGQFKKWGGSPDFVFRAYGHMGNTPKVGKTIIGEFNNSFIKFKITDVERCNNPSDMFFLKMKIVDQVRK